MWGRGRGGKQLFFRPAQKLGRRSDQSVSYLNLFPPPLVKRQVEALGGLKRFLFYNSKARTLNQSAAAPRGTARSF